MTRNKGILALFVIAASAVLAIAGAGYVTSQAAGASQSYTGLSFLLQGCNINTGETLPDASGKFICPLADYTEGNLGKNWNELDLVPHRIVINAGNSAPATQTYSFQFAVDYSATNNSGTHLGYDFIEGPSATDPTGYQAVSSGCQSVQIGPMVIAGSPPSDQTAFRTITVTQAKNTTCQIDNYARLGLGAHLYPGSSLHSELLNDPGTGGVGDTSGIGQKTNSIPTNQLLPPSVAKDEASTRNTDHIWNVVKSAVPASIDYGNVCQQNFQNTQNVGITVTWTRQAATASGDATVITHVYATNTAHRTITTNVSDQLYAGSDQSSPVGGVQTGSADVPANTAGFLVATFTQVISNTATMFNDVATGTYVDTFTGIPIPGSTTASASSTVGAGQDLNGSAAIQDTESITGSGLTFSDATPSPVAGSFEGGYTPGTFTTGPVVWDSGTQPGSGATTFTKTVKVDPIQATNGTLTDTASLAGSNGFMTQSAPLNVNIQSSASSTLTIQKTIPNVLQGTETQTFTFDIKNAANAIVASTTITFAAGDTTKSVDVSGLAPGTYSVTEEAATGWNNNLPTTNTAVDLTVPSHCSNTTQFTNTVNPASASAAKVTDPVGGQAGWLFTIAGSGAAAGYTASGTTDASGNVNFGQLPGEGTYTITETAQNGYSQVNATAGCTFTVNFPADAGKTFNSCVITNRANATLTIVKVTNPTPAGALFPFTSSSTGVDPSFNLDTNPATAGTPDTRQFTFSGALTNFGSKSVTEGTTANWSLDNINCSKNNSGSGSTATVVVNPGDNVTCTFTNNKDATLTIVKETQPVNSGADSFGFTSAQVGPFSLDTNPLTATPNSTSFTFSTGQFGSKSVTESTVPAGWTLVSKSCIGANDTGGSGATATVNVVPGATITCTYTNVKGASLTIVKDTNPVDSGASVFPFTGTGTNVAPSFSLDTHTAGHETTTFTFGNLQFGSKTVTEGATTGWTFTGASCVGDEPNSTPGTATVTVNIQAGDNVTCTYHNVKDAKLTIVKVTDPSPAGATFPFTSASDGVDPSFNLDTNPATVTPTNQQSFTFTNGHFGPKAVTEGSTANWTLTDVTCTKTNGTPGGSTATVTIVAGDDVTCTFTNTKDATITVTKVTDPANSLADSFGYTVTGDGMGSPFSLDTNPLSATPDTTTITLHGADATGAKTVTESTVPTGWTLKSLVCTGGGANTSTSGAVASIGLNPGENVVCTYTNKSRGTVQVVKQINNLPLPVGADFLFELRLGDQHTVSTAPLESGHATGANAGTINFTTPIIPGQVYAICELLQVSFNPTIVGYGPYNPADNANYWCWNFTITTAQAANTPSLSFAVENDHPMSKALTIGYWKNWSACKASKGGQTDQLGLFLNGITLGTITFTTNGTYWECEAVQTLSKNTFTGIKKSSDPLFNMAAQLLAADLNVNSQAGVCTLMLNAQKAAQDLLVKYSWNGNTYSNPTPPPSGLTAADATLANQLATTLDKYNNNQLC